MPWVLSFNGTISSNSSLIAQSSETVLTNTANCGLSWMSVDSSKSVLKYRDFSRSPDSCDSNDVLMSDILCSTVCVESCRPETERFKCSGPRIAVTSVRHVFTNSPLLYGSTPPDMMLMSPSVS
ncbi:hypothetical protein GOODEAATRI_005944 [Goodea atripinnis]|uniref:Uncharacterized protein n=1 Tax=Goodea atripinnis TaxID=208336 RepID=A0ABV0P1S5_9TELE